MKILILFLAFISTSVYSQKQVFNVQHYCIDELPFKKGQCDISGNEYSFVFLDEKKNEVVLFLTDLKFKYQIIATRNEANSTSYRLKNGNEEVEMNMNSNKTKIEFLSQNRQILLTVGKSTKQNR